MKIYHLLVIYTTIYPAMNYPSSPIDLPHYRENVGPFSHPSYPRFLNFHEILTNRNLIRYSSLKCSGANTCLRLVLGGQLLK